MTGLGHDHIIEVLDGQVVNMHSSAAGIYPIGVEWEQRNDSFEGELFEQVDLRSSVDEDGDVVELGIVALVHL